MNAFSVKALKKPGVGGGVILKAPLNFENRPWASNLYFSIWDRKAEV